MLTVPTAETAGHLRRDDDLAPRIEDVDFLEQPPRRQRDHSQAGITDQWSISDASLEWHLE